MSSHDCPKSDPTTLIVGRIVEVRTLRPLPGLTVVAREGIERNDVLRRAHTDADGRFELCLSSEDLRTLMTGAKSPSFDATVYLAVWNGGEPIAGLSHIIHAGSVSKRIDLGDQAIEVPEETRTYTLRAIVVSAASIPLPGIDVELESVEIGSRTSLTTGTTDDDGQVELSYSGGRRASAADTDLRLQLTATLDATELTRSRVLFSLKDGQEVRLVVASEVGTIPSERERITAAIAGPLGAVELGALTLEDVEVLARVADVYPPHLALLVRATALTVEGVVDVDELYAMGRAGLPLTVAGLLAHDSSAFQSALARGFAHNIVPSPLEKEMALASIADRMASWAGALTVDPATTTARWANLSASGVSAATREAFAAKWLALTGSPAERWAAVAEDPALTAAAPALELAAGASLLVGEHGPAVEALLGARTRGEIETLRDLAAWSLSDWTTALDGVGVPPVLESRDPAADTERLARIAMRVLDVMVPSAGMGRQLAASSDGALAGAGRFLQDHADFDIDRSVPARYFAEHPEAFEAGEPGQAQLATLARVQRVHALAPAIERPIVTQALIGLGIESAGAVVRQGLDGFVDRHATALDGVHPFLRGSQLAHAVFQQATLRHAATTAMMAQLGKAFHGTPMNVLPAIEWPEDEEDPANATLRALFGSVDYCACEHCRSVYGPAAYLVDLLALLESRPAIAPDEHALDVLRRRRPDITGLELSCANTNTVLPYVDLVLELLEARVVDPEVPPVARQTTRTAAELRLRPEHRLDGAYELAAEAVYPWGLPFDLHTERVRAYCAQLGATRSEAMHTLRRASEEAGGDAPMDRVAEALGLTPAALQLVSGATAYDTGVFPATEAVTAWGMVGGAWVTTLSNDVGQVIERSGLDFDGLRDRLALELVNPGQVAAVVFDEPSCDLADARIDAITAAVLDRLQRFVRLERATGLDPVVLDRALRGLGGALEAESLRALADARALAGRLQRPLVEVLVLWGSFDTQGYAGDPSPYARRFASRVLTPELDPAFALNSGGTELAHVVDLGEAHHPVTALRSYARCVTETSLARCSALSYVKSVERTSVGSGGYVVAELPPLQLSYSTAKLEPILHKLPAADLRDVPTGIDGDEYRLADLEGDGLPGIVSQQGDVLVYKRPEGDGRYGPAIPLSQQSTTAKLGQGGQLVDLDGDGQLELVDERGYYARAAGGGWEGYCHFRQVPHINLDAAEVKRVDLDGDGLPEIVVVRSDGIVWYPNRGREGYGAPRLLPRPRDERSGPVVVWQSADEAVVFADMTGDGLADIVRVSAGGVEYWPNLGYGKFGRQITMDGRPRFSRPDGFDPRRLRFGDLDGSGTTDIIMLHSQGATVWCNQAGNRLSEPVPLWSLPGVSDVTAVEVVDLFGDGTAGLLWSSASQWARPHNLVYLQVLPRKPHLLTEVRNGQGGTVRLQYESSARQALRDRDAGRPWVTRLPFPVQVVTRIEQHDEVARRRFVQRYAYHHGCYDGGEREFRGFGFVERWDTEAFEDFQSDGLFALASFDGVVEGLHQPPVLTRTWFHTGMYVGHEALALQHTREYWSGDAQAWGLPNTVLPRGLSADETLEAARALRGRVLREEVYALDGSELAGNPYSVTERNHVVRRVQRKGAGEHAVVFAHDGQTLTYHYERNPEDPRVSHALVLDVDDYGDVTRSAVVSWPRRSAEHAEQDVRTVLVSTASFAAVDDVDGAPDVYRAKMPVEARTFEALGLAETLVDVADASRPPIQPGALRSALDSATAVAPEASAPASGDVALRLLSATRTIYKEENLTGPLPLGQCGTRGFVHEVHAAAMSNGQVTAAYGLDVDGLLLADLGYVADDGLWWARSPQQSLDPAQFWQAVSVVDPFGGTTEITRDAHALFVTAVQDPVGNVVTVEHDYRVLAPRRITDPNGNRTAVGFDIRGMVVWTAVMGKEGAGEGDSEEDPTTVLEYDLFAWRDRGEPVVSHVRSRETHGDPGTRWLHAYSYSDGFGGVLLEKHSAAPGLAPQRDADGNLVLDLDGDPVLVASDPRWVGTGRVVLDNKGNPVRQYEPYFSSTEAYEAEAELREQGVTPVMYYDPLGRVVRTQWPDGTESRVGFSPWHEQRFDRNDTVLGSAWHAERMALAAGDHERRAALLTEAHADTPATAHLDALGRPFLQVEHLRDELGADVFGQTRLLLDVVGNILHVTDARGNVAEARQHGLLRQALRVTSEDAGERRVLRSVVGEPFRAWNSRGFVTTLEVDAARRPLRTVVTRPDASTSTAIRIVYGESVAAPEVQNLRGRPFRVYDGAGLVQSDAFDFAGNLVSQTRRLTVGYEETPSWTALDDMTTIADLDAAAGALLEAEAFTTTATFDALGRPLTQTTPDASVTSATMPAASSSPWPPMSAAP